MRTVLSRKGQIALPAAVRKRLGLAPGDRLEISVEDGETLTLRRIGRAPNVGLVDLLLSCPGPLKIPRREN